MGVTVDRALFGSEIKSAQRDFIFMDVSLAEKISIKTKPKFDTACWSFSRNTHNIFVGLDLFNKSCIKPEVEFDKGLISRYIKNHVFHEFAHGLYTNRDLNQITAALKVIKCPWSLFNLFEDACIEHRFRLDTGRKFEWLSIESLGFHGRPESILFGLIQAEGDVSVVKSALIAWDMSKSMKELDLFEELKELTSGKSAKELMLNSFDSVVEFYNRIIKATKSEHQIFILRDWIDLFGLPPEMPSMGVNDIPMSVVLSNEDAFEEFESDTISLDNVETVIDDPNSEFNEMKLGTSNDNANQVSKKGSVLKKPSADVDWDRGISIANKFNKIFQSISRVMYSTEPAKRLSAKRYLLGKAPYKHKTKVSREIKTIFFIIDCSGSMSGVHIAEARILAAAFSYLASVFKIKGHVALSAIDANHDSIHETFSLPMTQDQINGISAWASGEGLEGTIKENKSLIAKADHVFVYTDGNITDKPINKAALHKIGIQTWGLYAGSSSYISSLKMHFDKAIIRDNIEGIVDAMLTQI